MTKRNTTRGIGRDRTDWRRQEVRTHGGKIERRQATPEERAYGFAIAYTGVHLIETSIVRCCDEVKPGKQCPHGVWGFTKVETE